MSIAQGACPSCGAPISFEIGSSIAQVCKYCRHVVIRTDHNLQTLGRLADLAPTPSLVAIGDEGSIADKTMRIFGRVQLDHGEGPWDEWYIGFHDGTWGWLAYAQGNWYLTTLSATPPLPPWEQISLEQDIPLGSYGAYRTIERKRGIVVSGEGELPFVVTPGQNRYYVDCTAPHNGFGTLDFGDLTGPPQLFLGYQFAESALQIRALSERPVEHIETEAIVCPNCGGNIPALAPKRSQRIACPYCNTVSEISSRRILEQQEAARARPEIPLGSRGVLQDQAYVVCGYVERSGALDGERFAWQEYLLFGQGLGFRWLVKDETTWLWVTPLNAAEIDLRSVPARVLWNGRPFQLRNHNSARVDYVLGEFYWKLRIGETIDARDFINGHDVLSREATSDEVAWSLATPIAWNLLVNAFNLPRESIGAFPSPTIHAETGQPESKNKTVVVIIILVVIVFARIVLCGNCGDCNNGSSGTYHGGGTYYGGSSRGGK